MPEPSSDSLATGTGVTAGNGVKAEPARMNMDRTLNMPSRSSLDQINDNLGGFDPPAAELIGLPFGQGKGSPEDPTHETKGQK
jgi:hypothetical protein